MWLTQAQMAQLFDRSQPVIARHINNAFAEGEVNREEAYAKIAYLAGNATGTANVAIYNLDVIISVGYRVKSQRGVEFRRWATRVLKEYIVRGYALNRERLKQLGQAVEVMKRVSNSLDTEQVLDVVKTYSSALEALVNMAETWRRLLADFRPVAKAAAERTKELPQFGANGFVQV